MGNIYCYYDDQAEAHGYYDEGIQTANLGHGQITNNASKILDFDDVRRTTPSQSQDLSSDRHTHDEFGILQACSTIKPDENYNERKEESEDVSNSVKDARLPSIHSVSDVNQKCCTRWNGIRFTIVGVLPWLWLLMCFLVKIQKDSDTDDSFEYCRQCYYVARDNPDTDFYYASCGCWIYDTNVYEKCFVDQDQYSHVMITNGSYITSHKIKCEQEEHLVNEKCSIPPPTGTDYVKRIDNLDYDGGNVGETASTSRYSYSWIFWGISAWTLMCYFVYALIFCSKLPPDNFYVVVCLGSISIGISCFLFLLELKTTEPTTFENGTCLQEVVPQGLNHLIFTIAVVIYISIVTLGPISVFIFLCRIFYSYSTPFEAEVSQQYRFTPNIVGAAPKNDWFCGAFCRNTFVYVTPFIGFMTILGVMQCVLYLIVLNYIEITWHIRVVSWSGLGFLLFFVYTMFLIFRPYCSSRCFCCCGATVASETEV